MTLDDLTLPIVLGAAAVDSINPCAIGVILFLSSVLLRSSADRKAVLRLGSIYVATIYVVYVASGLGLVWFQHTLIRSGFAEIVGIVVGSLVILMGLIELKDAFWYGKGISLEIPDRYRQRLVRLTDRVSVFGVIGVGAFVAAVELPCTGGPYLAITALLAKSFDLEALFYLLLYNVIFVAPLLAIVLMIYFGGSTLKMKQWRQRNRKWMNLSLGTLMVVLGAFLIGYYKMGWHL